MIHPGFHRAGLTLAFLLGAFGSTPGLAQKSGEFRLLQSYVHNYETVEHSDESFIGGLIRGTSTIVESSGDPFTEGMSASARCLVFVSETVDLSVVNAPCTITDTDGDELYLVANRGIGGVGEGNSGAGRWSMEGGTGKYANITGACSYRVEYFPDNFLVTYSQCRWEKE
ncbi:MAG: hypothetical protein OXC91_04930 [Rhodobacteraceae bacterium]|nr:hypothetical protein [Paracoccaceae bacterium]